MVFEAHQGRKPIGATVAEYYQLQQMADVAPGPVKIVAAYISLGARGIAALCYLEARVPVPDPIVANRGEVPVDGGPLGRLFEAWPLLIKDAGYAAEVGQPDWVATKVDRFASWAIAHPRDTKFLGSSLLKRITAILEEGDLDAQNTIANLITSKGFEGLLCVLGMDELGIRGTQVYIAMNVVEGSLIGQETDAHDSLIAAVNTRSPWLIASVNGELRRQGLEPGGASDLV